LLAVLQQIVRWSFTEMLPITTVALEIILMKCTSIATCQHNFSKLKLIKTYLRSPMTDAHLLSLIVLSIERELAEEIRLNCSLCVGLCHQCNCHSTRVVSADDNVLCVSQSQGWPSTACSCHVTDDRR